MFGPPAVPLTPARDVWRLRLVGDYVNGFLLRDGADGPVTLVDTGISLSAGRLRAALRYAGVHPEQVSRIVLTHAHADHAGSVAALVRDSHAPVAVHVDDAADVRRGVSAPFNRANRLGVLLTRVGASRFARVPVAEELTDGQVLPIGDGLRVIHTPGHSPGHVSLLHQGSGVLITGDSIFNMRGRMTWPFALTCTDFPLLQETAARLADEEYDVAAFTHGPHVTDRAREQVRGFLARRGVR